MSHRNPQERPTFRYLAGRSLSIESIMADDVIAARSERAVRCAASRRGLALGVGSPFTIPLPPTDRHDVLEYAAHARAVSMPLVLEETDMLDRSLEVEFESYRKTLSTEARREFDERIERLLTQHGVDYVRGYVDALKDASSGGRRG
jgi:hypothetical protein